GWIRKFCGKGIFREIWKNRFLVLRGDQLFVCEKEVSRELGRADELLDLSDYERCEEIRKNKSRSKKNHSKFRLQRCSSPGNTVPNLLFLAVSPEEKESWINVLNAAITRAKNRILDEVTVEDSQLSHLTRDRAKIPQNRRLPTRGHLLAVASASSSDGTLTLDLIQEDETASLQDGPGPDCPRSKTDGALSARAGATGAEASGKSHSLPRDVATGQTQTPQSGKRLTAILTHSESKTARNGSPPAVASRSPAAASTPAISTLQELISEKLRKTERLLAAVRGDGEARKANAAVAVSDGARAEAERLLTEAMAAWSQAQEVLQEVTELRALCHQIDLYPSNNLRMNFPMCTRTFRCLISI
uniref:Pleckstrin homology domain containing, family O member 1b n=1 Tax=Sander lucioperca TaxID=283035 RepID=A0A8D0A6C8_SANLU